MTKSMILTIFVATLPLLSACEVDLRNTNPATRRRSSSIRRTMRSALSGQVRGGMAARARAARANASARPRTSRPSPSRPPRRSLAMMSAPHSERNYLRLAEGSSQIALEVSPDANFLRKTSYTLVNYSKRSSGIREVGLCSTRECSMDKKNQGDALIYQNSEGAYWVNEAGTVFELDSADARILENDLVSIETDLQQ